MKIGSEDFEIITKTLNLSAKEINKVLKVAESYYPDEVGLYNKLFKFYLQKIQESKAGAEKERELQITLELQKNDIDELCERLCLYQAIATLLSVKLDLNKKTQIDPKIHLFFEEKNQQPLTFH